MTKKCWICNVCVNVHQTTSNRVFCSKCQAEYIENKKNRENLLKKLKAETMLETALESMENQKIDMENIKLAIDKVIKYLDLYPEKFKSSHEVIVAIMLIAYGNNIKVNYRVGKYIVDFYIPKFQIIIEVDGYIHENNKKQIYDGYRDIDLRNELGLEWEIIHIQTEFVEKYAEKIPVGIVKIKKELQKIRKKNNGILPEHFAMRYRECYKDILSGRGAKK